MPDEIYFQRYQTTQGSLSCWWAIRDDACSFLVIDETNGQSADTSIQLRAGEDGNVGVLTFGEEERDLSGTGEVVHITADGTFFDTIPMTAAQVSEFLNGGNFPLSLDGVREFRGHST